MNNLIIVGSGAVAAELCSYISDINNSRADTLHILGFLDIDKENFDKNSFKYRFSQPFLGTYDEFDFNVEAKYIIAFANIQGRLDFINKVNEKKLTYYTVIHPSCIVSDSAIIGVGNIIYPNCIIGPGSKIGDHNLITSYSFISHDCEVGSNNFLSTSGLSGNVKLGSNNYFGIRATVIPDIKIGSNNLIQAGMIIYNDISNNETVFYKHKESIRIISKNE
jgi:sugar O-acyltransferase (sialic acid O-acetyltransferase NeuD family)